MRIIAKQDQKRAMVDIALGTGDDKDLQQRATLGALTKKDVFDLLNPDMELPEGVMRDDVRDNLDLFTPITNAPTKVPAGALTTTTAMSAAVKKAPGSTDRVVAQTLRRAPAAAPVEPRRPSLKVAARVPSRVPAKRPRDVLSGFAGSITDEPGYQKSVKKSEDGPTDWKGLLNKYGGEKRRKFQ